MSTLKESPTHPSKHITRKRRFVQTLLKRSIGDSQKDSFNICSNCDEEYPSKLQGVKSFNIAIKRKKRTPFSAKRLQRSTVQPHSGIRFSSGVDITTRERSISASDSPESKRRASVFMEECVDPSSEEPHTSGKSEYKQSVQVGKPSSIQISKHSSFEKMDEEKMVIKQLLSISIKDMDVTETPSLNSI